MKPTLVFFSALFLSGCALTPKVETVQSYWIYDIKTNKTPSQLEDSVVSAIQSQMSSLAVVRNIPEASLPEKPGRFIMSDAFSNTNFAALAANSGVSLKMVTCDGALATARSDDTGMQSWGENTTFNSCLWQYNGGYHLDIVVSFTNESGGYDAKAIAKAIMTPLIGNSQNLIPVRINNIEKQISEGGENIKLVDSYKG